MNAIRSRQTAVPRPERKTTGEFNNKRLYREVLYRQQGRCILCRIEEWQTHKQFDTHRIISGKHGGLYTLVNVVLVCRKCHVAIEGLIYSDLVARIEEAS